MVNKLFSLFLCVALLFGSVPAFAEGETGGGSGDSSTAAESDDVVSVVKVKDNTTGKVKEVEIVNGRTPEGKIFIGAAKRKGNIQKAQQMVNSSPTAHTGSSGGSGSSGGGSGSGGSGSGGSGSGSGSSGSGSGSASGGSGDTDEEPKGDPAKGLSLVENMRALKGKIGHYAADGTNCVRTIGLACQGTPYGTDTTWGGDINKGYGWGGYKLAEGQTTEMVNTEQLVAIARDLHQLIDSDNCKNSSLVAAYNPMPGDIAIVDPGNHGDHYQHAVMCKLNDDGTIGTIQNGSSHDGVYESDLSPAQMFGVDKIACYIVSSGYSATGFLYSGVYGGGGGDGVGGEGGYYPTTFEFVEQIGEALNQIVYRFSEVSKEAYSRLVPHAFELIALLAIIDLCLSIIMAGFEINPMTLFVKVIKYGFIYWVVIWWPDIVDMFFKSMVVSVNQTVNPEQFDKVSENICQPHLMLQKVLFLLKPGFDYVKNLGWIQTLTGLFTGKWLLWLLGGFGTLITLLVYFFFAAYICYVYVIFFICAGLSTIALPFMTNKFVKFFPEGMIGSVWTASVRLMVLTFMIALMTVILPNAGFEGVASQASNGVGAANGLQVNLNSDISAFVWYIKMCCMLIVFAFFSIRITDSISEKLGGRFEIGL